MPYLFIRRDELYNLNEKEMPIREDDLDMKHRVVKFESFSIFVSYLLFYICMYYEEVEVFGQSSGGRETEKASRRKEEEELEIRGENGKSFIEVIWKEY